MPDAGGIRFGCRDISDISLKEWRKRLGYVPQSAPLFSGTVRENIAYGIDGVVSDEKVFEAALAANCVHFIQRLEAGFETLVGEDGIKLSAGQRQRLAIARTFMRDPEIILLDEATASLDGEAERVVLAAVEKLMSGRTVVYVTHRLTMLERMDAIVVVEDGKVSMIGSHEELLKREGYYSRLISSK